MKSSSSTTLLLAISSPNKNNSRKGIETRGFLFLSGACFCSCVQIKIIPVRELKRLFQNKSPSRIKWSPNKNNSRKGIETALNWVIVGGESGPVQIKIIPVRELKLHQKFTPCLGNTPVSPNKNNSRKGIETIQNVQTVTRLIKLTVQIKIIPVRELKRNNICVMTIVTVMFIVQIKIIPVRELKPSVSGLVSPSPIQ